MIEPAAPEPEQKTRAYTIAPAAIDRGVPCVHCGSAFGHRVVNVYPNGNRRRVCGRCGKPFMAIRLEKEMAIR